MSVFGGSSTELQPAFPAPVRVGPERINENFNIEDLQYQRKFDIEVQNLDIRI